MSVIIRDKVTVQYLGKSFTRNYEVDDQGFVSVADPDMGERKSSLGDNAPDEIASILLMELVVAKLE